MLRDPTNYLERQNWRRRAFAKACFHEFVDYMRRARYGRSSPRCVNSVRKCMDRAAQSRDSKGALALRERSELVASAGYDQFGFIGF